MAYEFLDLYTDAIIANYYKATEQLAKYNKLYHDSETEEEKAKNSRMMSYYDGHADNVLATLRDWVLTVLAVPKFKSQRFYAAKKCHAIDKYAHLYFDEYGKKVKQHKPKVKKDD